SGDGRIGKGNVAHVHGRGAGVARPSRVGPANRIGGAGGWEEGRRRGVGGRARVKQRKPAPVQRRRARAVLTRSSAEAYFVFESVAAVFLLADRDQWSGV